MLNRVREVLVATTNVDPDKVTLEASLKDDLKIDSLDSVEIILELETEFDIKISDDEIEQLKTVKDIVDLLEKRAN